MGQDKHKHYIYRREFMNPQCVISVEDTLGIALMHCTFKEKWSKVAYRKSLILWDRVCMELISMGLHTVYAAGMSENTEMFAASFGFIETDKVIEIEGYGCKPLYEFELKEVI